MPIRIESAIYQNLPATNTPRKFQDVRYGLSGTLDYTVSLAPASAWSYQLVVSASASALGGGVSAGGVDTLEASFGKVSTTANVNQIMLVTDRAVTATAVFTEMQVVQQINPTEYLYRVNLTKVQ